MRLKKNRDKDLSLRRSLYFVLGLLLVLALIYLALEWKTEIGNEGYDVGKFPNKESNENLSTIVLTTKSKTNSKAKPHDAIQKEEDEFVHITFCPADDNVEEIIGCYMIDEPPIYPGCENELDKKKCCNDMMLKHIRKNIYYPETTENLCIQGKVYVVFVIEKDGSIGEIKTRGPHKSLDLVAKEVIEKLPKMIPGKHQKKAIRTSFSIPIIIN